MTLRIKDVFSAAALGLFLLSGPSATAQETQEKRGPSPDSARDRDRDRQEDADEEPRGRDSRDAKKKSDRVPRIPRRKSRVEPSKEPVRRNIRDLRRGLPPDSDAPPIRAVPPGEPRVTPGVTNRHELRRQRGSLGSPYSPNIGPTTSTRFTLGRRWVPPAGNSRLEMLRLRSRALRDRLDVDPVDINVAPSGVRGRVIADIDNDRTADWWSWYSDYYYPRYSWYTGSWSGPWYGQWYGRWRQAWQRYPIATTAGVTPWGLNRVGYWFGYNDYINPYYRSMPLVVGEQKIQYSQPLTVLPPRYENATALAELEKARAAFRLREYQNALDLVNQALALQPSDPVLHQFRALALFALGNYDAAAEALYPVLSVGPGWDWKTMRSLYATRAEYTRHLRALEAWVRKNDDKAHGHMLLGYHYMTTGYPDAAQKQFARAKELMPKDQVSEQLVGMLRDEPSKPISPAANLRGPTGPTTDREPKSRDRDATRKRDTRNPISVENITGRWTAKRGDEQFRLQLTKEMRFVWTYQSDGQKRELTGAYALESGTLVLEPQAGGVMLATIELRQPNRMQFQMVGSEADDKGLTFTK